MRILLFISIFACSVMSWGQTNQEYTDAQAAMKADLFIKEAYALNEKVAGVCNDLSAMGLLYEVAEQAVRKLNDWPEHNPHGQALVPYYSCRQSMVNVQSYAYACANGVYKGKAEKYIQRRWLEDSASCTAAIRSSGVSQELSN
ncbi:hypothetical protein ACRCQH_09365 [Pseudomonas aeruginosa]